MKTHTSHLFSVSCIILLLACRTLAQADAVVDWNEFATQASGKATLEGRPGPTETIDLAMVHIAIHDAVQAYEKRFEPYAIQIDNASGSPIAAIATAAHDVLVNRFPSQSDTLDSQYRKYLKKNQLSKKDPGDAVGKLAAQSIIAMRANDGSFPPNETPFFGGEEPGMWRPTPPAFPPGLASWLGSVTPFALQNTSRCRPIPPPDLKSRQYAKEYNEVKSLGSMNSTDRTPKQTELAFFYAENFVQLLSRGLRDIAVGNTNSLGDSARLFALNYISQADSIICAFESKYSFAFWRPVTAIHEGNHDGNPETTGDPDWLTMSGSTPPYPDYTSGANVLTSSMIRTLQRFFQTNEFNFVLTTTFPGAIHKTRSYTRFSTVAREVVEVRILQGIHFRSADQVARKQGKKVADYVYKHFLLPVD